MGKPSGGPESSADQKFAMDRRAILSGLAVLPAAPALFCASSVQAKSDEATLDSIANAAKKMTTDRSAVLAYLTSLPSFPEPPPPQRLQDSSPPTQDTKGGKTISCTVTKYTLSANPDKIIIFSPDQSTLWPGALLQGRGLLTIGQLQELPIKKRAPLPISIELLTDHSTVTVEKPSAATVESAIGTLVSQLATEKRDFGSSIAFEIIETYSFEQAAIDLGISLKYSGSDLKTTHSAATSSDRSVVTASILQKCFTVFIDNPLTPADFFSSDLSVADLAEQESLGRLGRDNIPVCLGIVTYGRMLYVTISSTESIAQLKDALNASFNVGSAGGSTTIEQKSQNILNQSQMAVSGIGVETANISALIQTGKVREFLSTPMNLGSAKPISYIFYNVRDLSIAGLTDTTTYEIKVCRPEEITGAVQKRIDAVDTNLKNYYNFVIAAQGNSNDWPTRNLRMGQYRGFHGEVIANLNFLRQSITLTPADVNALKDWIKPTIEEIDRQSRGWLNGGDPALQPSLYRFSPYSEAIKLSGAQRATAGALENTLAVK